MDWLDLLAVQGTLKSLLQQHSSSLLILKISVTAFSGMTPSLCGVTVRKHKGCLGRAAGAGALQGGAGERAQKALMDHPGAVAVEGWRSALPRAKRRRGSFSSK